MDYLSRNKEINEEVATVAVDNKSEGYYDEIDYPFERKDEVVALF